MKTVTATEAKNNFGQLLDESQTTPVNIQKNGRSISVLISKSEYDKLITANDITSLIMQLHEESIEEFGDLYTELAK